MEEAKMIEDKSQYYYTHCEDMNAKIEKLVSTVYFY